MSLVAQPAGTVTLLFTDIEGSTRLLAELGEPGYRNALAEHRNVVREAFSRHGGYEVDTQGDSFFYAFPSATGAVGAAREAMAALEDGPIAVRVGIHTGEPTLDPPTYVGLDVHTAARIMAAAHGGQIVLSQSTRDLLDDSYALSDLGEHQLKDLSGPRRLYQLGADGFPPLKTLHRTNLPIPASAFIGRERELRELGALLQGSHRCLIGSPIRDLPKPSHTRPHSTPRLHQLGIRLEHERKERPRTCQAHVPAHHRDELWQLVDARPSDDPANRGNPRVIFPLNEPSVPHVVDVIKIDQRSLVDQHAPELPHDESTPIEPDPLLAKDRRTGRRKSNGDGGKNQKRAGEHQEHGRSEDVDHPLDPQLQGFRSRRADIDKHRSALRRLKGSANVEVDEWAFCLPQCRLLQCRGKPDYELPRACARRGGGQKGAP